MFFIHTEAFAFFGKVARSPPMRAKERIVDENRGWGSGSFFVSNESWNMISLSEIALLERAHGVIQCVKGWDWRLANTL